MSGKVLCDVESECEDDDDDDSDDADDDDDDDDNDDGDVIIINGLTKKGTS